MPLTSQDLIYTANLAWPSATQIGYLALLGGTLLLGEPGAVVIATDTISTASAHGLVVGSRIRFSGTPPTELAAAQDYFAVPTTAASFQAAVSLADAQAATPVIIDLTTAGTGLLINEQLLVATDPPNVLVNKELPASAGYQRMAIGGLQPAISTGSNTADHPPLTVSFTNTSASIVYHRYEVLLRGATATIGSIAGISAVSLLAQSVDQPTAPNQTRDFVLTLGASDP